MVMGSKEDQALRAVSDTEEWKVVIVRDDDPILTGRDPPEVGVARATVLGLADDQDIVSKGLEEVAELARDILVNEESQPPAPR